MTRLCVIHHSHTDIGYTDLQSRITRRHVDFIRQALAIAASAADRRGPSFDGFAWTCESFWGVERFLEAATPGERERFVEAVRTGTVGLSASYLNFNELIGRELLVESFRRAVEFGRELGVPVDSAMTADINGSGWGYAAAMRECGVSNLFTCVHTHHGMYPLGRTQVPFRWEAPSGESVLVWSGEHYHFGNELGLSPGAAASYLTKDECDAEMIFHDDWGVAELRIPRYLAGLREGGYELDVVPVMVSGLRTDNGPPSARIVDTVERWNAERADVCRIEMVTLSRFFAELRAELAAKGIEPPVHRGDWPDWWSDGPGGNPGGTRLMREAQRRLRRVRALRETPGSDAKQERCAVDDLLLYAEHTFSHSNAMSDPWHPLVTAVSSRKQAYAAEAHDLVVGLEEAALDALGAAGLAVGVPLRYTVLNPFPYRVSGLARLPVGHHEFNELRLDRGAQVLVDGVVVPSQLVNVPMGGEYLVWCDLGPGQRMELVVEPVAGAEEDEGSEASAEETRSVEMPGACSSAASAGALETDHVRIEWVPGDGIVSWVDRAAGRELLRPDRAHAAFTPVYEVTPMHGREDACRVRSAMGLNRKGENVMRSSGCLVGSEPVADGPVVSTVVLDYGVAGSSLFLLELTAYQDEPRVDAAVRLHKDSVWEPENVYLSLPFAAGPSSQLWLGKAGAIEAGAAVRPRLDQIPGTLTDYYALDDGFAVVTDESGVAVAMPDCHLLQIGPLEFGKRLLAGDPRLADDPGHLYAWLMNNFWETNFAASLGGFHEFRFSVRWGDRLAGRDAEHPPAAALEACRTANDGLVVFRHE